MNLCRKWVSEKYLSYQHDFTVMRCGGGMCLSPINPCFQTIIFGFVLPSAELTDTLTPCTSSMLPYFCLSLHCCPLEVLPCVHSHNPNQEVIP